MFSEACVILSTERGWSVQGKSVWGGEKGVCPGRGWSVRGSSIFQKRKEDQEDPARYTQYGNTVNVRSVRILLECILVRQLYRPLGHILI